MSKQALILFSNQPSREGVRKNLGLAVKNSCNIHQALLSRLAKIINDANGQIGFKLFIVSEYSSINHCEIDKIFNQNCANMPYTHFRQKGANFDEKFKNSLKSVFEAGYDKVVIIGSDTIDINASIINDAFTSLDSTDIVIGPANDGGFYLLGLNEFAPQLFTDITWFRSAVHYEIHNNAEKIGFTIQYLTRLTDLDSLSDLVNWMNKTDRNTKHILVILYLKILSSACHKRNYHKPYISRLSAIRRNWQKAPPLNLT